MKMRAYPRILVTQDMIAAAEKLEGDIVVNQTKASEIDTLTGALGELGPMTAARIDPPGLTINAH